MGKEMSGKVAERASGQGRRGFLKLASLGAVASSVTAVAGAGTAAAAEALPSGTTGSGYRETPHVRKVYELARF